MSEVLSQDAPATSHSDRHAGPIDLALIYGAGFSALADQVQDARSIPMNALPGLAEIDADARMVVGSLGTARVAVMGSVARNAAREGRDQMRAALEAAAELGAKAVVFAGAAGSVREEIKPGALVTVRDHLNLTGATPLRSAG